MCKCIAYFQFALFGLVASAVAAPSGIYGGIGYAAAPVIVKSYPLADAVPAGLNGLQVKRLLVLVALCIILVTIFV